MWDNLLNWQLWAALFGAYALGSIPTAVWVGRWQKGIDIRQHGSGNAGLTNAIRVLGWKGAAPVLLVDLAKGVLAPWLAVWLVQSSRHDGWAVVCGLLAVLGHSFTCFASFKGGKGVLTGLGIFLTLAPLPAVSAFAVWVLVVWRTKYVSLGSVLACVALICFAFLDWLLLHWTSLSVFALCTLVASFVMYKHKANIARLRAGTENKLGAKK